MTVVESGLYSPRWGRKDTYYLELHHGYMQITMDQRKAKVTGVQGCDPEWSGEALETIMRNDSIYPPVNARDYFVRAWKCWRDGELSDELVAKEIQLIGDWINTVSHSKPDSEFGNKYF